jgi:hypothetical protein
VKHANPSFDVKIVHVFGGLSMMLANAIPTVMQLAIASQKKSLFVQGTLKMRRSDAVSTSVLSNAAKTQLTDHVTGLNVPQ